MKHTVIGAVVFLCLALLPQISADAQEISDSARYELNRNLLELIDSYERNSFPRGGSSTDDFLELFSDGARIYCDYFSTKSFGKQITPTQYAQYSEAFSPVRGALIENLRKEDYTINGNICTVVVKFDKKMPYIDDQRVIFSEKYQTLDGFFHVIMQCSCRLDGLNFKIDNIEGEYTGNPLGERFVIVKHTSSDDDKVLLYNGKPLGFTEDVENVPVQSSDGFSSGDDDIILSRKERTTNDDCRYSILSFDYKPLQLRAKAHFGAAPVMAYSVDSPVNFSSKKSSAYEVGADLAYLFKLNNKNKLGFGAGLYLSFSSLNLGVSDVKYSIPLYHAQKSYERHYNLDSVSEGLKFTDVVLPIFLAYEAKLSKRITYTIDLGTRLYLNMNTKVFPYRVSGSAYNDYGDGSKSQVEDISGQYTRYMVPVNYKRNTYDISLFAKTGVDTYVTKYLALGLQVGYEYGLTTSYSSNKSNWYSPESGEYPFIYSFKSGKDVAVRSFADCIEYRRNALWLGVGLKYKF